MDNGFDYWTIWKKLGTVGFLIIDDVKQASVAELLKHRKAINLHVSGRNGGRII
jgi:hypothetical protein